MNKNKLLVVSILIFCSGFFSYNAAQIITTIAGIGPAGYSGMGGPATAAELNEPDGMNTDATGNIYSAEAGSQIISMVNTTTGLIYTIAGKAGVAGYSGNGGQASAAELHTPLDIAFDPSGNMYIADRDNAVMRKVTTSGIISTFAGEHITGYSGDGGQATNADLNLPAGVTVDLSGNVYIADFGNSIIRKVNTSGIITTFAGKPNIFGYSGDGGAASAAELDYPVGLTTDPAGNLYICDRGNNRVRMITTSGIISTIIGNGIAGYSGDGGPAKSAKLDGPSFISIDPTGNLYFSDIANNCVREVNTSGNINTIAGTGFGSFSGDGGPATSAELNQPAGVVMDGLGRLFIDDLLNNRIREIYNCSFSATASVVQSIFCYGENNGSIMVTLNGGTGPYNYTWSGGAGTNVSASNLSAGSYTVSITDKYSCASTATVTITQPGALLLNGAVLNNESCYGDSVGIANVTLSGGTTPYTYKWTGKGGTNALATGLIAGIYTINITDKNGCIDSTQVTITQPPSKTIIILNTDIGCYGGNDGSSIILVTGGATPYTYLWSNGNTTSSLTHLSANTFTIVINDANNCKSILFDTIKQPPALNVTLNPHNLKCFEDNSGYITSSVSGGTNPYQYFWSPGGGTNASDNALTAGTYTLTITDYNGCAGFATVTITQPSRLTDTIPYTSICLGDTIYLNDYSAGGISPYKYLWSNGKTTTSISVAPKIDTKYLITVSDFVGCKTKDSALIHVNPLPTVIIVHRSSDSVCNSNGVISIYSYPSGGVLTGLAIVGTHFYPDSAVTNSFNFIYYSFTDSNGCSATATDSLFVEDCTGINQLATGSSNITIFPNPNNGTFTIQSSVASGQLSVEIYDVLGQRVKSEELRAKSEEINISNQPNGVYFYRVITESGNTLGSGKVVIQK